MDGCKRLLFAFRNHLRKAMELAHFRPGHANKSIPDTPCPASAPTTPS